MRLKTSISKSGVFLGLILAGASVVTVGFGAILEWKVLKGENKAYVQQAIGDTTLILAGHFKTEIEHLAGHIAEIGKSQLRPLVDQILLEPPASFNNDYTARIHPAAVGTTDTEPEILDVSLWKKDEKVGAFDFTPLPKRVYLAVNSRYLEPSAELLQKIRLAEEEEKSFVRPVFQGHTVVTLAPSIFGQKNLALIAAPLGNGDVDEIVVAHFRLESFQKILDRKGMVNAVFVDDFGNLLARTESLLETRANSVTQSPLFQNMHSSNLANGQITYLDLAGNRYFGGYSRIGLGQLSVLASLSESEASVALVGLKKQTYIYLLACFLFFLGFGYLISTWINIGLGEGQINKKFTPEGGSMENNLEVLSPKKIPVTVLYGKLRNLTQVLETFSEEESADAINDYLAISASAVREYGGTFEKYSGASFIAFWGAPESDGTEIWCALRAALDLRKYFLDLNESRQLDGKKTLSFGMGVHSGQGLAARLGAPKNLNYTVVGEVVDCAKALASLSGSSGVDLLVSQATWQQTDAKFVGESQGEAKLTLHSGLMELFTLSGFRDEKGQLVTVEAFIESVVKKEEPSLAVLLSSEKKIARWLVNNGSQIIGPFTPREIASRLFAQELDFDCECWAEGTGNSAQLRSAAIFTGSEDKSATLWMFDGDLIHGPITEGFLKTALSHGAISDPAAVYVCQESTVNGWKSLSKWDPHLISEPILEINRPREEELKVSLAPPNTSEKEPTIGLFQVQSEEKDPLKKAA